jgi:hypothetical protein
MSNLDTAQYLKSPDAMWWVVASARCHQLRHLLAGEVPNQPLPHTNFLAPPPQPLRLVSTDKYLKSVVTLPPMLTMKMIAYFPFFLLPPHLSV